MANVHRFRRNTLIEDVVPVQSATVIEIGDLVKVDTNGYLVRMSSSTDTFLGVAMSASKNGDTDPVRIAVKSYGAVFEFPLASAGNVKYGDEMTFSEAQEVKPKQTGDTVVGKVVQAGTNVSNVLIRI